MATPHLPNSGRGGDLNLAAVVARNACYHGDVTVLDYPDGDLTYRALDAKAARLSTVLTLDGTGDGDRVACRGFSRANFVTMLAALRIGAALAADGVQSRAGREQEVQTQAASAALQGRGHARRAHGGELSCVFEVTQGAARVLL
ncbi:AMP-binding protein [Streptomyces sp. BH106]|uniref:AMP-binding protein n=1 Tax=Streptomyces sp. BH106 TaxID=3410409 RepID=UPI003CEA7FA8